MFTGDEFRDGLPHIAKTLNKYKVKGSFFVTGKFLEDKKATKILQKLYKQGHYVGPHSDQHLLYSPWEDRDSLLISKEEFIHDLQENVIKLEKLGISPGDIFIPPFEWYNRTIVDWASERGFEVYNFTPGLRTAADYTYPEMENRYMSSERILTQLIDYEKSSSLNGFMILIHIGTDERREDKFYYKIEEIIQKLRLKNYIFVPLKKL